MELKCYFCNETLQLNDFTRHVNEQHSGKKLKEYNCPYCLRNYPRLKALIRHLKTINHISDPNDLSSKNGGEPGTSNDYLQGTNHAQDFSRDEETPSSSTKILHELSAQSVQPLKKIKITKEATDKMETHGNSTPNYVLELQKNTIPDSFDYNRFNSSINSDISKFVIDLYGNPTLCRSITQKIVNGVHNLTNKIFLAMKENAPKNNLYDMETISKTVDASFLPFSSEYRSTKTFKNTNMLITSVSKEITFNHDSKRKNGDVELVDRPVKIETVPIKKVLKQFLELPDVFNTIIEHIDSCKQSQFMISPVQGPIWKNIESKFSDKLILPLIIYNDDFEINNPLGSHKNLHKIGAVYYTLGAIPNQYKGMLENLFLSQLYLTQDYKSLTNGMIFANLIDEIKDLQTNGIVINVDGKQQRVYFPLLAIVGDNLSLNSLLGFPCSFNATSLCRICRVTKTILQSQTVEDPNLLRTKKNYAEDVELLANGIKEECVFNEIPNYHCVENPACDPTHDLLEGVDRYILGHILNRFIKVNKFFSLEALNWRIKYSNYGPSDTINIPPPITAAAIDAKNIKLSASEMKTLVLNLIYYVGDVVPENNEEWKLYLLLRKLHVTILKTFYTPEDILLVKRTVSELNSLWIKIFKQVLVPKMHFLVHYPRLMKLYGPLHHLATIRFEAKHQPLKNAAEAMTSRVNPAHTLAHKHQLQMMLRSTCNKGFSSRLLFESELFDNIKDAPDYVDFQSIIQEMALEEYMFVPWVKIYGTYYNTDCYITTEFNGAENRRFGEIKYIGVKNDNSVVFLYKKMKTIKFVEHIQSYEVTQTQDWGSIFQKDLMFYKPLNMHFFNYKDYLPIM